MREGLRMLEWTVVIGVLVGRLASAAGMPMPVSPGSPQGFTTVQGSCPTFSWSGLSQASAYELVVYPVGEASRTEAEPAVRVTLPGAVGSWTPSLEQCLEAGRTYAWSVRAEGRNGTGRWSEASLFRVASGPSTEEVEEALAVLQRFVSEDPDGKTRQVLEPDLSVPGSAGPGLRPGAWAGQLRPGIGETEPLAGPTLGAGPSLTVDGQIHLGEASDVFKGGAVFLWSDAADNVALGRLALSSNTAGSGNTAIGHDALYSNDTGSRNTALGRGSLHSNTSGIRNTAVGDDTLYSNDTGSYNTAIGRGALRNDPTASSNTAIGYFSLSGNTTGSFNTVLGHRAGALTTGSSNILINNPGVLGTEDNTLRIGQATGKGNRELDRAFVHGINGNTVGGMTTVYIDPTTSQLGTAASSTRRLKQGIRDMGTTTEALLRLRPVTFRFKNADGEPPRPVEYGLIAEEVAEIMPELVALDDRGRPESVKYRLLAPMLLNEVQKQRREIRALQFWLGAMFVMGIGWVATRRRFA